MLHSIPSAFLNYEVAGAFNHISDKRESPAINFNQSCTSEKCCAQYKTIKWTSRRTGEVKSREYVTHYLDKKIKYRAIKRSELHDNCPDCNSALFTERTSY